MWTNKWINDFSKAPHNFKKDDLEIVVSSTSKKVYSNYKRIKSLVKNIYFKDKKSIISRYKRAAVITYAILLSDPIEKKFQVTKNLDDLYLKQRLAFYMGIASIIQDFPQDQVENLTGSLFQFDQLGKAFGNNAKEDDFLTSVYKDLMYAEIYKNYDVLAMANVFGLLTERASALVNVTPIK